MPYLDTRDGAALYYEDSAPERGEGLPLVLLPGMLGSLSSQWTPGTFPTAGRRILRFELRGHGRSLEAGGQLTVSQLCDDLECLLDRLDIQQAHLVGYSLGGYVGLLLASRSSARLASLLMHGTKFYWTPPAVAATLAQLDPDVIQAKVPRFAESLAAEHGPAWKDLLQGCARLVENVAKLGLGASDLAQVDCPVLVSVGDRDELVPVEEAAALQAALPAGQLMVLPRVRHPFSAIPAPIMSASIERLIKACEPTRA